VLERHGAGAENGHSSALGKHGGGLEQRRLADARRTSDDRERAPPEPCGGEQPLDRCELPLPLEHQAVAGRAERGVGEVSHRHGLILAASGGDDQLTSSGCGAEKISDAATMRARRPARILLLMTHTTEKPSPPTTTEPADAYALGRSREEYERLTRQAALFSGVTQRLFRAAGLAPGMRVLDVGSGAGDVAFLAAELVGPEGAVVGVDVDGAALATARARAELLRLQNVRFVEGDVRTAALGDDFDAAVGRLILMYLEDPAQALRAIAARVRAGGAIAFQELDLDPGIGARSLPGGTLWDETGELVIEAFARAGAHVRMGRQLYGAFLAAGLAAPEMCEEALVGGGPDFGAYAWLAGVAHSLAPLMQRLGLATAEDLGLDTLAERIRDDAVASRAVVWTPPLIGAYARTRSHRTRRNDSHERPPTTLTVRSPVEQERVRYGGNG
jgi:SAM-dependent methyltransferase